MGTHYKLFTVRKKYVLINMSLIIIFLLILKEIHALIYKDTVNIDKEITELVSFNFKSSFIFFLEFNFFLLINSLIKYLFYRWLY